MWECALPHLLTVYQYVLINTLFLSFITRLQINHNQETLLPIEIDVTILRKCLLGEDWHDDSSSLL